MKHRDLLISRHLHPGRIARILPLILFCLGLSTCTGMCAGENLTADQWNDLGVDRYVNESYPEALEAFDAALRNDSVHELAWYNKGLTLFSLGSYEEAVDAYRASLASNPDSPDCWYNLGLALELAGDEKAANHAYARSEELTADEKSLPAGEEPLPDYPDGSSGYEDATFDRLYGENDQKITEALHQVTSWISDENWGEADQKALSTSRYLTEYSHEL